MIRHKTTLSRATPRILAAFALLFSSNSSFAGSSFCEVVGGGYYCQYQGRVAQSYVNNFDQILLYFDPPMLPADAAKIGATQVVGCIVSTAGTVQNERFGKLFYATILAAQAARRDVVVQMRAPAFETWPRCDRVWMVN
jgi:hypothetical protein